MKKFYLKVRAFLMSFAMGLASVSFAQSIVGDSFENTGSTVEIEPPDAVLIIPAEEKQTRSKLIKGNIIIPACSGGVPAFENKPLKKERLRTKK